MCGIAGIFGGRQNSGENQQVVEAMLSKVARRGPDGVGISNEASVMLGHRRLQILDLSDAGHQPMVSRCGRYVIAFNGECYNYKELAAEVEIDLASLRSQTDTEVLLEAWAIWGPACLPKLVGQFVFAVYDRQEQRLWLARDRFGEKPCFYHLAGGRLTFASSIPALLEAPWVPRELDPAAVLEYITLRYVVSPATVLKNVMKLPPGSLMRIDASGVETTQWYDPHYEGASTLAGNGMSRRSCAAEFDRLFRQATSRCLVGDVPAGLLLSDGIDSHAISMVLGEIAPTVQSFTYGYKDHESRLTLPRGPGTTRTSNVDFCFSVAERVAAMRPAFGSLTEPIGDGASLATWLLLKQARASAKIFLCGHGADEILGGYRLSQDCFRLRILRYLSHLPMDMTRAPFERYLNGSEPLSDRVSALRNASAASTSAAARYLIHRPLPLSDVGELTQLEGDESPATYLNTISELYGRCRPETPDLGRIQKVMIHTFLSENILSFSDSVSMDSSVEMRMPFLDRDLAEFAMALPSAARVGMWPGKSNTKRVMRWWGKTHLDPELVRQKKRSFDFGSLRPMMVSHRSTLTGYILDSTAVRRHLPGVEGWLSRPPETYKSCWQGTMWALLALGIWCDANGVVG